MENRISYKEKEEDAFPPPFIKNKIFVKLGIVGDYGNGKTTLTKALVGERFDEDYPSTLSGLCGILD